MKATLFSIFAISLFIAAPAARAQEADACGDAEKAVADFLNSHKIGQECDKIKDWKSEQFQSCMDSAVEKFQASGAKDNPELQNLLAAYDKACADEK